MTKNIINILKTSSTVQKNIREKFKYNAKFDINICAREKFQRHKRKNKCL
jgi:hypothetical protein